MRVDVLHLARHLRRSPISAFSAAITIALTLGAVASIFAVIDAVVLTPPPFANPDALFTVGEVPLEERAVTSAWRAVTYTTFDAWRDRTRSLASLEAFDGTNVTLTDIGQAERLSVTDATPGLLTLLGVSPVMGRTFAAGDVGQPVAIVSNTFWRGKLGADVNVIGREILLGGRAHTVIGVLPERFVFALGVADVWRPLAVPPANARNGVRVLAIARLNQGVTASQLAAALDDVSRLSRPPARVVARKVAAAIAGNRTTTLALLAAAAGLAMLIAFANLAGLLIVRSIDRRRELAVRTALGARPGEIARQLLLESGAIVALGASGGVLLAWWMTPAVANLVLERVPGAPAIFDVAMSWRVIGALMLLVSVCAWICGSLPAMSAARWNIVDVLRRGVTPSKRERDVRRAFVVGEVTLAFVLLVLMSLLGRSLINLIDIDPGFDARDVLALQVSLPPATYPAPEQVAAFYSTLQAALAERLGSRAVAVVDEIPLSGSGGRRLVGARPGDAGREAIVRSASPGYFEVMHIPVVMGRAFEPADNAAIKTARVVISQSLADNLFASAPAVGRQIWLGQGAMAAEVIGVVGDVKHRTLDETTMPAIYQSALQEPSNSSVIVVRTGHQIADVIAVVRDEVARLDSKLPVYRVRPMAEIVAGSPGLPARRLLTAAFAAFAILAVVLSAIGLFGVAAHDVACRRTELTLRIALGANPMALLRATLGRGIVTVAIGLMLGSVLSIWAVRAFSGVVFTGGRADLLSIAAAAMVLMAAGICAALPAALSAARTDPRVVLYGQ